MSKRFRPGDPVIYRMQKNSTHPGPRAEEIVPAAHGDTYSYLVDKFWRVKDVRSDGQLLIITRRGKQRVCDPADPNLRHAGILARLIYHSRFPGGPY